MVVRTPGTSKLTPQRRQRLPAMVGEARSLVYGEAGWLEWGTPFAVIEDDAREVGHEFIRLLMHQATDGQGKKLPAEVLVTDSGEAVRSLFAGWPASGGVRSCR